jgi:hypothetical protein
LGEVMACAEFLDAGSQYFPFRDMTRYEMKNTKPATITTVPDR